MHFTTSIVAVLAAFTSVTLAQPVESQELQRRDPNTFSPEEDAYYSAVGERMALIKKDSSFPKVPECDLGPASMPKSPTPLPPISQGFTLSTVVIGRGTQNYTCDTNTAASTPVAAGALASLFNVSCIASLYPELLTLMPNVSVRYPVPKAKSSLAPANLLLTGQHYFTDNTTPFFDLGALGNSALAKNASVPAPDASRSVAWLKLVAKKGATCTWGEVYRVNTAGGQPPKTCEGQPSKIQVEYAAEYWFYAAPK